MNCTKMTLDYKEEKIQSPDPKYRAWGAHGIGRQDLNLFLPLAAEKPSGKGMGCLHPFSCSYTALSLGLCGGCCCCPNHLERFGTKTPNYKRSDSARVCKRIGMCMCSCVRRLGDRSQSNLCSDSEQSFSTQVRVLGWKPINSHKCFSITDILFIRNHLPSWKITSLLSIGQYVTAYTLVLTESN